jgi:hypothetical protein
MKVFVFLERVDNSYNVGLLSEDEPLSKLKELKHIGAIQLRDLINNIPTECIFVGIELRKEVLSPFLHELCKNKLNLPDKLEFHWVPPYKLPLDDVFWIYNYGMFNDNAYGNKLQLMIKDLNLVSKTEGTDCHLYDIAQVYFTLIGNFDKLNN